MLETKRSLAPWYRYPITLFNVIGSLWLAGASQAAIIIQDNFNYVADRNVTNVQVPFQAHGWSDVKAQNSNYARGSGYLYTRFDATLNSRVLAQESLPDMLGLGQTDYYLKYGSDSHPAGTIPANVWFQYWLYATPGSAWAGQKFLYPCYTNYPCPAVSYRWIFGIRNSRSEQSAAPPGGHYFQLTSPYANYSGAEPWNATKLDQNLVTSYFTTGVWRQFRIHIDTSGAQGTYELWARERGVSTWTKYAEWIGGVTPNFTWPIPAGARNGNIQLAIPTTVDSPDSTIYMDDFIMATSLNDLGGSGDTTPPQPPQDLQVVP